MFVLVFCIRITFVSFNFILDPFKLYGGDVGIETESSEKYTVESNSSPKMDPATDRSYFTNSPHSTSYERYT